MLNNFLKAQLRNPSKGKSDLNDYKINENLEQISNWVKINLRRMLR